MTWYLWVILVSTVFLSMFVGLALLSSTAHLESLDDRGLRLKTALGRPIRLPWSDVKKIMRYQYDRRARLVLYLRTPRFLALYRAYSIRVAAWDYPQQQLVEQLSKYVNVAEQRL